jgi:hypothetical protein
VTLQHPQHRQRLHYVAQRTGFEDQNLHEVTGNGLQQ